MKRTTVLIWTIVVLVLLNLTTIGTMYYHMSRTDAAPAGEAELAVESFRLNNRSIVENLGLSGSQANECREILSDFREKVRNINQSLNENRADLFGELRKEAPDAEAYLDYSAKIGELHKALKMETVQFYLALKSLCDPAQEERLNQLLAPLFSAEKGNFGQGGKQHRNRFGRGHQ